MALTIVLGPRGTEILNCRTLYRLAIMEIPDTNMEGIQVRKNFEKKI